MKKIFVLAVLLVSSISLVCSQNIDDIFKDIPFDILPGLSDDNKNELLINRDVSSVIGSFSRVSKVEHTDTFIKLKTSEVGTTQIKLLPKGEDEVVVLVVKTVCDSICDSSFKLYSTSWDEIENVMPTFSIDTFFDINAISKILSIDVVTPLFVPIIANVDKDSDNIVIKIDLDNLFTEKQKDSIMPYLLNKELNLQWNGSSFSIVE